MRKTLDCAACFESGRRSSLSFQCCRLSWASKVDNEAHAEPSCPCCFVSLLLLFLSACSELGQARKELPGAAFAAPREVRGWGGEGRSLRAGSGAGGTEPSSPPTLGGELATLQKQGLGLSVTRCPWPGPAAWLPDMRCPLVLVHVPEWNPSQKMGSDERSLSSLAAFLLILMISQVR